MKKQFAKTISTLSLLLMLSAGAVNVSAFPGCDTPGCRCSGAACKLQYKSAAPALTQNEKQVPAQDPGGQETVPTVQADISFSFSFFLMRWAMTFLYLP